jgi:hypothetical protein
LVNFDVDLPSFGVVKTNSSEKIAFAIGYEVIR